MQTTPAQIRKDFSHFGKFGKQGRGYNIDYLLDELREILNLNQKWNTCVVGIGNLGQAVINYQGFENEGYLIKAAFDVSIPSNVVNKDIVVKSISEMKSTIKELNIKKNISIAAQNLLAPNHRHFANFWSQIREENLIITGFPK